MAINSKTYKQVWTFNWKVIEIKFKTKNVKILYYYVKAMDVEPATLGREYIYFFIMTMKI